MKHTNICFKLVALLLCLAALLSLSACGEGKPSQSQVEAMNSLFTLTAYGGKAEAGLSAAESVLLSMDAMLDPGLTTSVTYSMNHADGGETVIPGQVALMLSTAQTVYKRSGGALDLTIYPLVKLWGFEDGKFYVPTDLEIADARYRLCFDELILTSFPNGSSTVVFPSYGRISFAAVGRGCASDFAIDAMRNVGVESGLVSLSGHVQTLGLKPDGDFWTVGIADPEKPASYVGTVRVGEAAISTSGRYQCCFTDAKGKSYHHLLNPVLGIPANNTLEAVSVICEDGVLADCLSTALFVLGESKALNYWRSYGEDFDMILITTDKRIVCTSGLMEEFSLVNRDYTLSYTE